MRISKPILTLLALCLSLTACSPRVAMSSSDIPSVAQSDQQTSASVVVSSAVNHSPLTTEESVQDASNPDNSSNNQDLNFQKAKIKKPIINKLFVKLSKDHANEVTADENVLSLIIHYSELPNQVDWQNLAKPDSAIYMRDLERNAEMSYDSSTSGNGAYILMVPKYIDSTLTVNSVFYNGTDFQKGLRMWDWPLRTDSGMCFWTDLPEGGPNKQITVQYGTRSGSYRPTYNGKGDDPPKIELIKATPPPIQTIDSTISDGKFLAVDIHSYLNIALFLTDQGMVYWSDLGAPVLKLNQTNLKNIHTIRANVFSTSGVGAMDNNGVIWTCEADELGSSIFQVSDAREFCGINSHAYVDPKQAVWTETASGFARTDLVAGQAFSLSKNLFYTDQDSRLWAKNTETDNQWLLMTDVEKFVPNMNTNARAPLMVLRKNGDLLAYEPVEDLWSKQDFSEFTVQAFASQLTLLQTDVKDFYPTSNDSLSFLTLSKDNTLTAQEFNSSEQIVDSTADDFYEITLFDQGQTIAENANLFAHNETKRLWVDRSNTIYVQ